MDESQQHQQNKKKKIVEALILAAPEPITPQKLAEIVPHLKPTGAKALVAELKREYEDQDRAFEVWEVAGGYQIRTRPEYSGYLRQLQAERPLRLSRAALETLAVVAYKQPVTRAEIENVRGVDVGATVRSLVDRHLIRIAGHRDVPGRPMLYGTSKRFLEVFGLTKLEDLPTLRDIEELLPAPDNALAGPDEPLGPPKSSLAGPDEPLGPPESSLAGPDEPLGPPESSLAGPDEPLGPPDEVSGEIH